MKRIEQAARGEKLSIRDLEARAYLLTPAAAAYLTVSDAWLRVLRARGEGPAYFRLGRRVAYRIDDLNAWAERFRVGTA